LALLASAQVQYIALSAENFMPGIRKRMSGLKTTAVKKISGIRKEAAEDKCVAERALAGARTRFSRCRRMHAHRAGAS
jgi:hypothetical protein